MFLQLLSILNICLKLVSGFDFLFSNNGDNLICLSNKNLSASVHTILPKIFEAHLTVYDRIRNQSFEVVEYSNLEETAIKKYQNGNFSMCKYRHHAHEGHSINGIKCKWTKLGPTHCFCSENTETPPVYVSLFLLFGYLQNYGPTPEMDRNSDPSISDHWQLSCKSQNNSTIVVSFTSKHWRSKDTIHEDVPTRIVIQAKGSLPNSQTSEIDFVYDIAQFEFHISNKEELLPPRGIFCPHSQNSRSLPELGSIFSLRMETILPEKQMISYTEHSYDALEKIVAFNNPNIRRNLLNLRTRSKVYEKGGTHIIHDFQSGIQYSIDFQNLNCSVSTIPETAFDVALVDNSNIRMRHANELLSMNSDQFVYVGERYIRGIPSDVWVLEKSGTKDEQYITLETYFSKSGWKMENELFNQYEIVPLGMATYVAKTPMAQNFSKMINTYYYDYKLNHPDWTQFDTSLCQTRTSRLFLVCTLKVSYSVLVQAGLLAAEDSIRRMLAELAGISPLRVTNIFLSVSKTPDAVDVWFVLLEETNIVGNAVNPRPRIVLDDAYLILLHIIEQKDLEINLNLNSKRHMKVHIKQASLELTSEFVHPRTKLHEINLIKAGFSAGSMAALGISMAFLGVLSATVVGYVLWRRGTGIPYFVHD